MQLRDEGIYKVSPLYFTTDVHVMLCCTSDSNFFRAMPDVILYIAI